MGFDDIPGFHLVLMEESTTRSIESGVVHLTLAGVSSGWSLTPS